MKIIAFGPIQQQEHIINLQSYIYSLQQYLEGKGFNNITLDIIYTLEIDKLTQNTIDKTFEVQHIITQQYCPIQSVAQKIIQIQKQTEQQILYFQIPSLKYLQQFNQKSENDKQIQLKSLILFDLCKQLKQELSDLNITTDSLIYELYNVDQFTYQMYLEQREFHDDIQTDPYQQLKLYFPNEGFDITLYPTNVINQSGIRAPITSVQIVQYIQDINTNQNYYTDSNDTSNVNQAQNSRETLLQSTTASNTLTSRTTTNIRPTTTTTTQLIPQYVQRKTNSALPFNNCNFYKFCNELLQIAQFFNKLEIIYNKQKQIIYDGEASINNANQRQQTQLIANLIDQDRLKNWSINVTINSCIQRLTCAFTAVSRKQQVHDRYIERIRRIKAYLPIKVILKSRLTDIQQIKLRDPYVYKAQRGIISFICVVISNKTRIQINDQLAQYLLDDNNNIKYLTDIILTLECCRQHMQIDGYSADNTYIQQLIQQIQKQQYNSNQSQIFVQNQKYQIENIDTNTNTWFSSSWDQVKNQIGFEQVSVDELNELSLIQDSSVSLQQLKSQQCVN